MKILLLGLSGSGKSTLAPKIAERFGLNTYEADDEVMSINSGIWPSEDAIVDKGFKLANAKALVQDNIIFVTTFLSYKDYRKFVENGFKVINMFASFEELSKRKVTRDNAGTGHINKFRETYKEYMEFVSDPKVSKHISASIDSTNLSSDKIVKTVVLNPIFRR